MYVCAKLAVIISARTVPALIAATVLLVFMFISILVERVERSGFEDVERSGFEDVNRSGFEDVKRSRVQGERSGAVRVEALLLQRFVLLLNLKLK